MQDKPKKKLPGVRPDASARPIAAKTDEEVAREVQSADSTAQHARDMRHWPYPYDKSAPLDETELKDERVRKAYEEASSLREGQQRRFRDREHWAKAMFEGYEEPPRGGKAVRAISKALGGIEGIGVGATEEEARANARRKR